MELTPLVSTATGICFSSTSKDTTIVMENFKLVYHIQTHCFCAYPRTILSCFIMRHDKMFSLLACEHIYVDCSPAIGSLLDIESLADWNYLLAIFLCVVRLLETRQTMQLRLYLQQLWHLPRQYK